MPEAPAPAVLPVFPLTGSLLLPGTLLPLNVFEPRYRNMVADALEEGGHIGMIQPLVPAPDNFGPREADPDSPEPYENSPELYEIGCAGRLARCEPQPDGRYHVVLEGVCRFRIRQELPEQRGYRRVSADYSEFLSDLEEPASSLDPGPLLRALKAFGERHRLEFDYAALAGVPGVALLNGLAAALPFRAAEKQALVEAPGPEERLAMLLVLMGMGMDPLPGGGFAPPIVH
jgi:uncharacterized protein